MESNATNTVPVAPLDYQKESNVNALDLVVFVARWCVALGAVLVSLLAVQIAAILLQRASINRPQDWISLAIEVVRAAIGLWALVFGVRVIRGRYRAAQYLWMPLLAVVLICVASLLVTLVGYAQN